MSYRVAPFTEQFLKMLLLDGYIVCFLTFAFSFLYPIFGILYSIIMDTILHMFNSLCSRNTFYLIIVCNSFNILPNFILFYIFASIMISVIDL